MNQREEIAIRDAAARVRYALTLAKEISKNSDPGQAVAVAGLILESAQAKLGRLEFSELSSEVRRLGLADAATPLGAIEALSKSVHDGANAIADSISGLEGAIDRT